MSYRNITTEEKEIYDTAYLRKALDLLPLKRELHMKKGFFHAVPVKVINRTSTTFRAYSGKVTGLRLSYSIPEAETGSLIRHKP